MNQVTNRSEKILAVVITLIALTDVIWLIFFLRDLQAQTSQLPRGASINVDASVVLMHVRIAIGLVIAAIGSWFRRVPGLLISIASLIWVISEYASWYAWTAAINRDSGVVQTYGLYGASLWNWLTIFFVVGLLALKAKMSINLLTRDRSQPASRQRSHPAH
jgi:hypothetical protein